MLTVARCWRGRDDRMRVLLRGIAMLWVLFPGVVLTQASKAAEANRDKARQVLASTIQALGGPAWLNLKTMRVTGRTAAFFHGDPTGAIAQTTLTTAFATAKSPSRQRTDLANGKVVELYVSGQGWEITYRGKRELSPAKLANELRWSGHSLDVALCEWYGDPATVVVYAGQAMVNRRLADKVTILSGENSVMLEIDASTHLPARLSFSWRDPQFHDKNLDAVEYDNYRQVDGIVTPFTITWTHNGETVEQRFLENVRYDVLLPPDFFNPDVIAAHLKK
jgi:hypothetical protein